jgi:hypothetical protein
MSHTASGCQWMMDFDRSTIVKFCVLNALNTSAVVLGVFEGSKHMYTPALQTTSGTVERDQILLPCNCHVLLALEFLCVSVVRLYSLSLHKLISQSFQYKSFIRTYRIVCLFVLFINVFVMGIIRRTHEFTHTYFQSKTYPIQIHLKQAKDKNEIINPTEESMKALANLILTSNLILSLHVSHLAKMVEYVYIQVIHALKIQVHYICSSHLCNTWF